MEPGTIDQFNEGVLDAEAKVLAFVENDNRYATKVLETLSDKMFSNKACREIFISAKYVFEKEHSVTITSIYENLKSRGLLDEIKPYMVADILVSQTGGDAELDSCINIISENYYIRKSSYLLRSAIVEISSNKLGARGTIDKLIKNISDESKSLPSTNEFDFDKELENVLFNIDNQAEIIPTKIDFFDRHFGGLLRKELTIIAGRPGHMKTTLAAFISKNIIKNNISTVFFSAEMSTDALLQKMLSMETEISGTRMKLGKITGEERKALVKKATEIRATYQKNIKIYDKINTIPGIISQIYRDRPSVVFIDFIQYLNFEKNDRYDLIIYNSLSRLKDVAKDMKCSIVVLSQLNRSCEARPDKRPRPSDLKESGGLEELSAQIVFVYWDYKYTHDESDKENFELIIGKSRYSNTGRITLKIRPDIGVFDEPFRRPTN